MRESTTELGHLGPPTVEEFVHALVPAVEAIRDLGGCLNEECREPNCWLGSADEGTRRAVREITDAW